VLTEVWLGKKDLIRARQEVERFLNCATATAERKWQALAWEVNARVAIAEIDLKRAQDCVSRTLVTMEGFEIPLAYWRVHATAAEVSQRSEDMVVGEANWTAPDGIAVKEIRYAWKNIAELIVATQ
jgi:hypothetical protein